MANYGEELGVWYLRLNGFFPIANFVLHRSADVHHAADCDILAIRPPSVFEEVGGQPGDWDEALRSFVNFDVWSAVIVEVKTGEAVVDVKLQNERRLTYALARLGVRSDDNSAARNLLSTPSLVAEGLEIHKLVLNKEGTEVPYFHTISLRHTIDFIKGRFDRYTQKNSDRVFFNSELMQFLIAEAAQGRAQR
jgi:hypothetical protein